jgi:Siphovirus Gp157
MQLYKIANEYEEVLAKLFDEETGEVNENAVAILEITQDAAKEKSIAIASYIKNLDVERKAIEEAKKEMIKREARLDKEVDYLNNYIKINMERCGISEIKSPYFVIKLKKCPIFPDIVDENSIPDNYKKIKQVVTIDKLKLREEMLAGVIVPGAQLKQNNRLSIK